MGVEDNMTIANYQGGGGYWWDYIFSLPKTDDGFLLV